MKKRLRTRKVLIALPLVLIAAALTVAVAGWTGQGSYFWAMATASTNRRSTTGTTTLRTSRTNPRTTTTTTGTIRNRSSCSPPAPRVHIDNDTAENTSNVEIDAEVNNTVIADTLGIGGGPSTPWFDLQIDQRADADIDVNVFQRNYQN